MEDKKKQEQQMIDDEYGKEFSGCLWLCIACLIGIATLGSLILFT